MDQNRQRETASALIRVKANTFLAVLHAVEKEGRKNEFHESLDRFGSSGESATKASFCQLSLWPVEQRGREREKENPALKALF